MLPQSECLYFTAIYATIACLCVGAGRAVPLSSPSILIQQQLRGSDDPRSELHFKHIEIEPKWVLFLLIFSYVLKNVNNLVRTKYATILIGK